MLRAPSSLLVLAGLLEGRAACADPDLSPPHVVRLEYTRTAGAQRCPDQEILRAAVGAEMGRDVFTDESSAAQLQVTAERVQGGYQARIVLRDSAGGVLWTRDLVPRMRCIDTIEDLGIIIAIHLDPPEAVLHRAPAPPPPTPPLPAAPPERPPPAFVPPPPILGPPVPPPRPLARPWSVWVGGGVSLGIGTSPLGWAPGFTLVDVGVRWSAGEVAGSLGGELRYFLPVSTPIPGDRRSVDVSRWAVSAVPCLHWRFAMLCGVFQTGPLVVVRPGFPASSDEAPWTAIGGRVGGEVPLVASRRLVLRLSGDVMAKLYGQRINLRPHRPWATPPVSGEVGAGLVTFF